MKALILAMAYSFCASLFFSIESLFVRYLDQKGIPGDITGICYMFFEGCIGTVFLVMYSCMGRGIFDLTFYHLCWVFLAGVLVTTGLVL